MRKIFKWEKLTNRNLLMGTLLFVFFSGIFMMLGNNTVYAGCSKCGGDTGLVCPGRSTRTGCYNPNNPPTYQGYACCGDNISGDKLADGSPCDQDWECNSGSCKNNNCASSGGATGCTPSCSGSYSSDEIWCEGGGTCSPYEEIGKCSTGESKCRRRGASLSCSGFGENQCRNTSGCSWNSCPPPCDPNNWGAWGACSAACGGGTQTRTNGCGQPQFQACNTQACVPTATPTPISASCARKIQGDANCDGKVDGVDYSLWLNSQCHPAVGQSCSKTEADFNKDGNVDDADYQIWFTNRGT